MPHGNAQGAGLCVLSHETCMPPLTSTHKHPTYWPERRHRTHPRPPPAAARDHARRDRARVSHGRRGRRAAHPARCRNDPDRDRRLAPPHTAHSDPGPTDTHGPHIARGARAHATARARDALSAPCGALGGGSGRPTEPPPHPP